MNPLCDGDSDACDIGEVRVLTTNPYICYARKEAIAAGSLVLCRNCYERQMIYRRAVNVRLDVTTRYGVPVWEQLPIYRQRLKIEKGGCSGDFMRERLQQVQVSS